MVRAAARRLYRDCAGGPEDSVVVAGTARSGTTWLAELIQEQLAARLLFEPFHPAQVPEYRDFHYFQYARVGDADPALHAFCARLLGGRIRNPWIDRQVSVLRPTARVVKPIRANLLLAWLRDAFPEVPMLLLVRHPCAVVLSRLELEWATDGDIRPFLEQPDLIEDQLRDVLPVIERADHPEEKHAVVWCVHYRVPLRQLEPGAIPWVFYEELVRRPDPEIERIFAAIGRRSGAAVRSQFGRASSTTGNRLALLPGEARVARWCRALSREQVRRILDVVEAFGLSELYADDPFPKAQAVDRLAADETATEGRTP